MIYANTTLNACSLGLIIAARSRSSAVLLAVGDGRLAVGPQVTLDAHIAQEARRGRPAVGIAPALAAALDAKQRVERVLEKQNKKGEIWEKRGVRHMGETAWVGEKKEMPHSHQPVRRRRR